METIKYKKQFVEKLRRMRENQIGKIVKKKVLLNLVGEIPTECWEKSDCVNVCMVGMSDWFGNYL